MKEIRAIIQPFMLPRVIEALKQLEGVPGVTVGSEVRGFGKNRAADAEGKVVEDSIEYARKVRLEIVLPDHLVDKVVDTIRINAHTGRPGDGKIFISAVDEVVKIRTGERGEKAI